MKFNILSILFFILCATSCADFVTPTSQNPIPTRTFSQTLPSTIKTDQLVFPNQFVSVAQSLINSSTTINVEMYELSNTNLIQSLIQAHKEGKNVKVILDSSANTTKTILMELQQAGILTKTISIPNGIDHVKLLVTNNEVLTGGINWGQNSMYTTDLDVLMPTYDVPDAEEIFNKDWSAQTNELFSGNLGAFLSGPSIEAAFIKTLDTAKKYCFLATNYLTDRALENALVQAKERNIKIKIILNKEGYGATKAFYWANENNISIVYYPLSDNYLHAKVMTCDNNTIIGSANFSYDGFNINHELDIQDNNLNQQTLAWFNSI